ncbi:CHAT domain-containing protein [Adonisia turfae]|uniref:CHAT domain-containing protein n=1 Tax=Adonisia turfae CCMR0081 TaxID=2292702 RepID=A0A6M0RSK7_9CYAN|nr:CHAT domain-containing protein [Adonisia turfae]NEZ58701.1 CHAT domain-containing protein [Adonisia turfae CCMR0081]
MLQIEKAKTGFGAILPEFARNLTSVSSLCTWERVGTVGLTVSLVVGSAVPAIAQSITSANDPVNTIVTPQGNGYLIDGGTLSIDGGNLFQSFEKFGLTQGEWATFLSTPSINNILGRVVGGDPSIIDGLLQVTGGNSNLFLLNPSGIVFGTNASLDLPAAFNVSTATGIGFEDGWFEAFETGDYSSLTGEPLALRFDSAAPGSIVNAGTLALSEGATLSLVGGTVVNTGTLQSTGGNVSMVSVPGSGQVELRPPGWVLGFEVEVPQGNDGQTTAIAVWDLPGLLTEGAGDVETGLAVEPDGAVTVAGADTVVPAEVGTTIAAGVLDVSNAAPDEVGGEVNVLGERVGVIGAEIDASGANGGGTVLVGGDYQGNGTVPNALRTFVDSDSVISVDAVDSGNAGQTIFWADGETIFFGEVTARGGSEFGDGGLVEISGKESLLFQGDVDTSASYGSAGTLLFDPININIVDNSSGGLNDSEIDNDGTILSSDGIGVSFTISEETLEDLSEDTNITLQALEDIVIEDLADNVLAFADGPGGSIIFTADADGDGSGDFSMDNSDTIRVQARDITIQGQTLTVGNIDTRVRTDGGRSGDINLEANADINVVGTGVIIDSDGSLLDGSVGTPGIQRVSLASFVGVSITGGGTAGNISIVSQNGSIDTTSAQVDATSSGTFGAGGNITIQAEGNINTGDIESFLGTNNDGTGTGGDISIISTGGSIDTTAGSLQDVSANSNRGTAGNVLIRAANQVTVDNVSAQVRSNNGTAGSITIISQSDEINVIDGGVIETFTEGVTGTGGDISLSALTGIRPFGDLFIDAEGEVNITDILPAAGSGTTGDLEIISRSGSINALGRSISTQTTTGEAGDITLRAGNNIEVGSINAEGQGVDGGGIVNAIAGNFFRASEIFSASNGVEASISTVDSGDGGDITITHGGGFINVPFTVGDASVNGTAGAITSAADNVIDPVQVFPGSFTQGNIRIITPTPEARDVEEPDPLSLPPIPDPTEEVEQLVAELEEGFTSPYTDYFGSEDVRIKSLDEIQNELLIIEKQTNVRPAIIYAFFVPSDREDELTDLKKRLDQRRSRNTDFGERSDISSLEEEQLTANELDGEDSDEEILWRYDSESVATEYRTLSRYVAEDLDNDGDTSTENKEQDAELVLLLVSGRDYPVLELTGKKYSDIEVSVKNLRDNLGFAGVWEDGSKQLYQALVANLVPSLEAQTIENLVFIMDTNLRALPLSALSSETESSALDQFPISALKSSDTGRFLIQDYSVGLMPSMSLTETRYKNLSRSRLLAMGTRNFDNLRDLPSADAELSFLKENWARPTVPTPTIRRDQDFTKENLNQLLTDTQYDIVHLATHAKIGAGDVSNSFIQFSDGPLNLKELEQLNLSDVDLLTLSACQTASDDKGAELGFSGLAQQAGVKSVLASLKPVRDFETYVLMSLFYTNLQSSLIKADALRKTQLMMLEGEFNRDNSNFIVIYDGVETSIPLPTNISISSATFSELENPQAWSQFTMVGSPW